MNNTPLHLQVSSRRLLADQLTPVSLYARLRDRYAVPVLLESNDRYNAAESTSFIGLDPIATFRVEDHTMHIEAFGESDQAIPIRQFTDVPETFRRFLLRFQVDGDQPFRGFNGLFGHTAFDAVGDLEELQLDPGKRRFQIPSMRYHLYRFVLAFDPFHDHLYILENRLPGMESQVDRLLEDLHRHQPAIHPFHRTGEVRSNLTDEAFRRLVEAGKHHCQRGDVFQIVFSRQFEQDYQGDDLQVYRALRSINPSPYLFYFDFGNYRMFGSSPEAQLIVRDRQAEIHPIAGTFAMDADPAINELRANALLADPKENAEHVMLVDLARNDLNRHAVDVHVAALREIHAYSHVMHLVSKVKGRLADSTNPIQVFADTFPAGTLSGAPKYRALELIHQYENQHRGAYGGAIGYIDLQGNMNQAIMIRSFFSQNQTLYSQAGAGIVLDSVAETELQEVNHKLGALQKALAIAETI
ncbi:MAG: anthranilate synthase component I family protein [Lewinellaceae bacterium]|nr:anthranilate synthase component I family protein [Lewinellaceae bacterium]HRW74496.1 anthranilate synthase component I family protein [Saprospiraceae bacterium]